MINLTSNIAGKTKVHLTICPNVSFVSCFIHSEPLPSVHEVFFQDIF